MGLQYQRKIGKRLKEYFADPSRARIPWFTADVYRFTSKAVQTCDNMTPFDGTHFSFCPNVLMAKIILNAACDVLGVESCPAGTSTQLSLGVDCYQQGSAGILQSGLLLAESLPDW
jgi:hypothetical protein